MATIVQQTNGEKEIFKADEYTLVQQQLATMTNTIGTLALQSTVNTLTTNQGDLTTLKTTDKGSLVQAINDNVSQLADIMQDVKVNFGAKGDGITDDTTAVQNAINYVATNGGTLFFPSGTYLISSSLSFNGMTGFKVNGAKAGLNGSFSDERGAWLKWNGASEDYIFKFNDCQNFEVRSIGFHGNSQKGDGILVSTDNNPISTNMIFSGLFFYQPNIGLYLNNGNNITESDNVTCEHIRMAEVGNTCFITDSDNVTSVNFESNYTFTLQTGTTKHYDIRRGNIIKMFSCAGGYGGDFISVTDLTSTIKVEQCQCEQQNGGNFINVSGVNSTSNVILENNIGNSVLIASSNRRIISNANNWNGNFTLSGSGNYLYTTSDMFGSAYGYVYSGSNNYTFNNSAQYNVQSSNGYTTLPNGMIFQWGSISATDAQVIPFTKSFPTNVFNVQVSPVNYGGWVAVVSTTLQNFKLGSQAGTTAETIYWTAIGN